jgi:hypothetical protein
VRAANRDVRIATKHISARLPYAIHFYIAMMLGCQGNNGHKQWELNPGPTIEGSYTCDDANS